MYVRWDASMDFNFTGTEVWVYGSKYNESGLARFYMDGVFIVEVDLFHASSWPGQTNSLLFHMDDLLPGPHVLTVQHVHVPERNADGTLMRLDGFAYMPVNANDVVRFTATEEIRASAGDTASLTVTRNAAARDFGGYYNVTLPEFWELLTEDLTIHPGRPGGKGNRIQNIRRRIRFIPGCIHPTHNAGRRRADTDHQGKVRKPRAPAYSILIHA
jgi:hypothetical protein